MKRTIWFLALLLMVIPAQAQDTVVSQSIIITPNNSALQARVWPERGHGAIYNLGESIELRYEVTQDAYVYIYAVNARGEFRLLFPNAYETNNFVRRNRTHSLPSRRNYSLTVAPPAGEETLQILATTFPFDLGRWARDGMLIQHIIPPVLTALSKMSDQFAVGHSTFTIVDPQSTRTLRVQTPLDGVSIYVNGFYQGQAPLQLQLKPGRQQILAMKPGYTVDTLDIYGGVSHTWSPNLVLIEQPASPPSVWNPWGN